MVAVAFPADFLTHHCAPSSPLPEGGRVLRRSRAFQCSLAMLLRHHPGMSAHTFKTKQECNPSSEEAEARGLLPEFYSKFKPSLSYVDPVSKKKKIFFTMILMYHEIFPFKVCSSLTCSIFSTFTGLCGYYH